MSKPSHNAYAVREYMDGTTKKRHWYKIGSAWPTKSGNGFNVTLVAVPVDGQVHLIVQSEEPKDDATA